MIIEGKHRSESRTAIDSRMLCMFAVQPDKARDFPASPPLSGSIVIGQKGSRSLGIGELIRCKGIAVPSLPCSYVRSLSRIKSLWIG
jgi:hypothetical protein